MKNIWKAMKKCVNRYLESLAKENEKSFGTEKLDCCDLNKKGPSNTNKS